MENRTSQEPLRYGAMERECGRLSEISIEFVNEFEFTRCVLGVL